jgi:murein DD-endopeptidase MepM/ murein hydrolase activator NlpD
LSQINLACGAAIYQGQLIGLSGSTGNSTGAHLHFEMRHSEYGRVNPWQFLP